MSAFSSAVLCPPWHRTGDRDLPIVENQQINDAFEKLRSGSPRYRLVLEVES
jgi:hypothetical protein